MPEFYPISTHGNFQDLRNRRFGRWSVLGYMGQVHRRNMWWSRCDCGTERKVNAGNLLSGKTQSCGCLSAKLASKRKTTHGKSNSPELRRGFSLTAAKR